MTDYMLKRLARAAALRASGVDWERVAAAVGSRPEVCRRWPATYPAEWWALVAAARRTALAEAQAEARQVLAELARSPDEGDRKRGEGLTKQDERQMAR